MIMILPIVKKMVNHGKPKRPKSSQIIDIWERGEWVKIWSHETTPDVIQI